MASRQSFYILLLHIIISEHNSVRAARVGSGSHKESIYDNDNAEFCSKTYCLQLIYMCVFGLSEYRASELTCFLIHNSHTYFILEIIISIVPRTTHSPTEPC